MIFIIRRSRWILGDLEDEEATKRKGKGKRPLGKGGGHTQYPGWNLDT